MEIVQNLFRTLMFFLDNIVYGLIPTIYKLFVYLANLNLYGNDSGNPIQSIVGHIYVLLGIFMLFKVSFSLLQYIVDPSSFRDSSKGMGKLVTNVLVAMVLLVSVPFIFEKAMDLQATIVESNAIGQLILGQDMGSSSDNTVDAIESKARDVQFMMFGAFYSLNPAVTSNEQFDGCEGTSGVFGSIDMAKNSACLDDLNIALSKYDDTKANNVTLYSFFKHGADGQDDRKFGDFDKLLWWKVDGQYVIDYLPFISTAVGVYIVFLLITFCADIALRAIKLLFLQMIAPIAIVSYIDPKESISNGKMSAWIKETASTYFSLFIRLATVFLVVMLVSVIASSVLADGGYISGMINPQEYNIWIYLFLIIGAFMFARQVPKIIESIFGIKGSGNLSLNPFKTVSNFLSTPIVAAGGAAVGGALGAAAANTIAAAAPITNNIKTRLDNKFGNNSALINFRNKVSNVKNAVKPFASAASPWLGIGTGAVSGAVRGARAGYSDKNILSGANKARLGTNQARYQRDVNQEAKYGVKQRISDNVNKFAGIKNKDAGLGKMDKDIKSIKKQMSDLDMQESGVREQMAAFYKHFDRETLNKAIKAGSYEEYLKTENINIPVSKSNVQSSTSTISESSSSSSTAHVSSDGQPAVVHVNGQPMFEQSSSQSTNRPPIVTLDGQPMFKQPTQSNQGFELPKGIVDEKTFNEYKSLYDTVESINEERETLRQQSSRLEDVSNVRNMNNRKG